MKVPALSCVAPGSSHAVQARFDYSLTLRAALGETRRARRERGGRDFGLLWESILMRRAVHGYYVGKE